ncbi:hypothetical protein AURDEDRAFT_170630 [Auricularia subglabra TFB-10046 SS5]|nr:hypothetical protein AURDEDRAFT_170630 [Auricularia subglabra TFB-10046 SS5]
MPPLPSIFVCRGFPSPSRAKLASVRCLTLNLSEKLAPIGIDDCRHIRPLVDILGVLPSLVSLAMTLLKWLSRVPLHDNSSVWERHLLGDKCSSDDSAYHGRCGYFADDIDDS